MNSFSEFNNSLTLQTKEQTRTLSPATSMSSSCQSNEKRGWRGGILKKDEDKVEEKDICSPLERNMLWRDPCPAPCTHKSICLQRYILCMRTRMCVCVWMIYGLCLPYHISAWPAFTGLWMINYGCPSDSPGHLWSLAPQAMWWGAKRVGGIMNK